MDLTRKCQLRCTHCYNGSGPEREHGAMSSENWVSVLDQAADIGVRHVQFIGGEPTLHPEFTILVQHALDAGLHVEVFSNLVHVSRECWKLFQRQGVSLATSYYSDQGADHDAVTRRPSHSRTRANIALAVGLGVPLRVGIVTDDEGQVLGARTDLESLGVRRVSVDRVRPFGRGGQTQAPDLSGLCGRCGHGTAAVGPDGTVSPCVFSGFVDVGNVRNAPLADILGSAAMSKAREAIGAAAAGNGPCGPTEDECTPGFPGSSCTPRH
ncbi:radical SAM/SPASM domain-containing protein [Streptantibioticus parmotrematis]|uniref:radical SAM/SPASM domain-containing protein n=1 Tax=Streptantibioticus parmotrematis TaxID=2873249 RepID=UPI0033CD37DC